MSNKTNEIKLMDPTRVITVSNGLSVLRAFLAIPIVYSLSQNLLFWTVSLIVIAIITDFLDGVYARKAHAITNVGKILDPVADKIVILGVLLFLILDENRDFPPWFFILYTLRDLSISISALIILNHHNITVQSNLTGKWSICISTLAIFLYIIRVSPYDFYLLLLATLFLLISWIQYGKYHLSFYK